MQPCGAGSGNERNLPGGRQRWRDGGEDLSGSAEKTESSSFVGERDGDPGEGESSTGSHPNHRTGRFPEGMFRDSGTKDKPDQAMHGD